MIIAQVCLRLATIKGHSKIYSFTVLGCPGGSENQNYGGVYVGLPADLNTVAASQSKSTRKGEEHTQRKTVIKIK
uniref:Uncharacterized protein n=1 Tax=Sinocyclocheilus grahami TaxID=75366 RepID=A0A672R348_SINGR